MAANPFDQFDGTRPSGRVVTLPPDPDKAQQRANEALRMQLAVQAAARAQAAESRAQADFNSKNELLPPPGDATKTGEEYLATLPPGLAAQVKAVADGRRALPTSGRMNPAMQQLIAAATQYDPQLDAANAATRVATRKKFTSGTTRDNITAINTALGHLGTLWGDAQKLNNFGSPVINAPVNYVEGKVLGDERYTNFNLTRQAVVDELEKAFRGSGGTQAGIEGWKDSINSAQSPKQLRGAIGKAVELLDSRLQALSDAYASGMGKSADPMVFLNPHAQQVFGALGPGGDGNVAPTPKDFGGAPPILRDDGGPPPSGGGSGGSAPSGPTLGLATGATRDKFDPGLTAKLDRAIRAGLPYNTAMSLFPTGTKPADRATYEAAVQFAKANPGYNKSLAEVTQSVPTTALQRFAASPLAAGIAGAGNAMTAGTADELIAGANQLVGGDQSLAEINAKKQLLAAEHPIADVVGNVVGGTAATLGTGSALRGLGLISKARAAANPILSSVLGDAAYGGAYGAGENNDNRLAGLGLGLVAGGAGSALGAGATKALGATVRGAVNPAAERLRARGIPLTVGEVLGGGWKKGQDALTSVFGPGNMVARRYQEGREALNKAAFNEAGNIVGARVDEVGRPAIQALEGVKSNAYDQALNPVSLDLTDPAFAADMANARTMAAKIPNVEQAQEVALNELPYRIGNATNPQTGLMSGRGFQETYRGLSRTAKDRASKSYGYEVGQVMQAGKDALVDTLNRQAPGAVPAFQRANAVNRHLSTLIDAVNAARNQVDTGEPLFTPAQLQAAADANTRKFSGKAASAAGYRPFNQLATDAQQVMSSKLPESGTAVRRAAIALATGVPGAGLGYTDDGLTGAAEGAAVPLGLLSLGGTKIGQKLLVDALIKRTVAAQQAGARIANRPQIGASILASAGIPLIAGE
jgi:hypothetical protein